MVRKVSESEAEETGDFLSSVADELEAQAGELESVNGAAKHYESSPGWHFDSNFGGKMVYTACYTLSYGICFPVFWACQYVPKNNEFVHGLVDGGTSASTAVDGMMERVKEWRLARSEATEQTEEEDEVISSGAEALAPA